MDTQRDKRFQFTLENLRNELGRIEDRPPSARFDSLLSTLGDGSNDLLGLGALFTAEPESHGPKSTALVVSCVQELEAWVTFSLQDGRVEPAAAKALAKVVVAAFYGAVIADRASGTQTRILAVRDWVRSLIR